MKIRKLIALLAAVLMLVSVTPISVFAEMGGDFPWTDESEQTLIEQILERDGLIDGIWWPWFNGGQTGHNLTGNDLMADYYNSSSSSNWDDVEMDRIGADSVYRQIYNLKAMGYNILAYGGSIMGEGVIFDANGDVTGIKAEYLSNVRRLLDMCREIGMPVMWNVYFHCSSMPQYYGIDGWKVICSMLGNNDIADNYAENFVRPLCEVLAEYTDVVALVSIADEPENEINDLGVGNHYEGYRALYGVNQEDMIYFMQQINEVVREELPGVPRTVASNSGNKTIYRDFDLDLMGHNQYTDGSTFKSIESLITDADTILTEYNVGSVMTDDEAYADKLIEFRQWMMDNGYKGGFQWCWMPNANRSSSYALQSDKSDNTSFRKTVTLLKYFMDEYRAAYRGETLGLVAPVLYANDTSTTTLKFIPSKLATKITIQRSDNGGSTWKTLVSNVTQSDYVNDDLVGVYTDSDTTRPSTGYCYRIIATDGTSTVTSEPNNVAGSDLAYKVSYTSPTYVRGSYVGSGSVSTYMTQLTSFGVEANRPLNESFNLIENGSFESTGGQWNTSSFLTYASVVSDSTTPLGEKSLYFNTSSVSTKKFYTFIVDGLEANTDYTFSAFLKGAYLADDNKGFGSVGVIDPYNNQFMVWKSAYPRASRLTQQLCPTAWDDEWHLRSVSFNTGDSTSYTIALYGYSSKMWVDGLALFESANGAKYENGESAKAITTTTYNPESGAANAVTDPTISNSSYWNVGAGYKQGFMSITGGALKYTASSDPVGVRYTKWIDVKPGTDYYYSFTVKTTTAGGGRVAILDNSLLLPNEVVTASFSSVGTKTYTGCISTGEYDQLGLCVVDLGGVATIDNVYLYEGGESVEIPTEPSYDGYIINGTFEIGSINNWENLWSNNTVEMVAGYDSLFALKGTANSQYAQVRQQITVEPNTDYVIEVWSKDVSNTSLLVKDSADSTNMVNKSLPSGSTWTKTTVEFNSGDNEFVYLGFMGGVAGATYTVDNVRMYKKEVSTGLVNGDFENGEDGWTYGSGSHAISTDAHGGSYALQLTNPSQWGSAAEQTIEVEANTSYTITWWYKATSGTGVYNLYVMNAAGYANLTAEGGQNYMNNYTGAWQQGTYVVNTGSATSIILKFSTEGSNPGTILVDDVVIVKTADAECSHSYTSAVTTAATCGATGVRTYTCSLCGDSYTETIPATGNHTYDNVCDTSCNVCGATRTVTHVYSGACDNYCNLCGAKKSGLTIGVSHTYDNACDGDCNVCGEERDVEGHVYDNACDKDCNKCGTVREVSGHNYVGVETQAPDCENDGVMTYTCSACGDSYTEAIDALGHSYKGVVTAPDCENDGYTTYTCGNCGDTYVDNYVDADGHSYEYSVVAAANCGYDGMGKYTCSVCGDSYTVAIRATGNHKYDNDCDAQCNVCRKYREVGDHTYVGVETQAPTCTEPGVMTYTCSSCGVSYTEAIPVIAHSYNAVVTEPDCVNGGYTTYTCSACGDSYVDNYVDATGHNHVGVETQAPTCGEDGVMTYTCSACGDSYTEAIPATGEHTYEYDCDKNCAVCGNETRPEAEHEYFNDCETVCLICNEETREASHNVLHVEALAPTCVAAGNIEYWYCDVCGAAWLDADCIQNTNLRAVKLAATGEHSYEYDCDKNCAVCGNETRPEAEHEYFNDCETVCMICYEETREASHNVLHVEAKDATCTALGNIEYWCCETCGQAWLDEAHTMNTNLMAVKLPMIDHTYDNEFDADCNACGAVREAAQAPITFGGNSVSEDVSGLAFKFDVAVDGMMVNGTTAIYDGATVGGYKLISMGAIVTNGKDTIDIPAVYLCDVAEDAASYAVRVIKIPTDKLDVEITATPYIVVEIDGVETTIYGEAQVSSYNDVLNG